MNPRVISEEPMNIGQVKGALETIKKRDGELNIRSGRVEDYVNSFMPLSPTKAQELYEKLEKLGIPRMKDVYYHKIIDVLPQNMNVLKAVLRNYPVTISNDNLKKILDLVKEYAE